MSQDSKSFPFLLKITEIGTVVVIIVALIGGTIFLGQNYDQVIDYKSLGPESFSGSTMSHQMITASIIMLIVFQCLRLLVLTMQFMYQRNWAYVAMGIFILSVITYASFGYISFE